MVSSTPRPHFTPGEDPVPTLQVAGWAPGSVWTGGKSRPHRDSIPDRPARSQSLYRLSNRPTYTYIYIYIYIYICVCVCVCVLMCEVFNVNNDLLSAHQCIIFKLYINVYIIQMSYLLTYLLNYLLRYLLSYLLT